MYSDGRSLYPRETALAAESHTDHNGWTALTADGGTLESGNYYLAGDVTLTADITVPENAVVTLCLNGCKLTGTGTDSAITVKAGGDFTLEDCQLANEECQHAYYVAESGLWVFCDELSAEAPAGAETGVVKDGVITGGDASSGVITGGKVISGGVHLSGGTFTMNGGTISGNTTVGYGGGVFVYESGTFTMSDSTISGNTVSGSSQCLGGGIYFNSGCDGTMSNCTVSDNKASDAPTNNYGGGIFTASDIEINGCTISGNEASGGANNLGGGVYISSTPSVTIKGSTISGNTATTNGGGVCMGYVHDGRRHDIGQYGDD